MNIEEQIKALYVELSRFEVIHQQLSARIHTLEAKNKRLEKQAAETLCYLKSSQDFYQKFKYHIDSISVALGDIRLTDKE